MLHLARVSSMVKLDSVQRKDRCEICGQTAGLVVTPIYTLTHLASSYRQQRDMSPLWNMVFWKHFYKTFTPTCTTCEECRDYYHSRNQNVPVDEKRFRRLQEREKTPFEMVQESQFQPVPIDKKTQEILHLWLFWTRRLAAGEDPRNFLPEYGIEGRTLAEMRQANLKATDAGEDDTGIPVDEELDKASVYSSEVDDDDPDSVERHRVRALAKLREQPISDDEGEDFEGETPFFNQEPDINWSTRTLAVAWLNKARQNMAAPQLQVWAQPLPPAMFRAQEGLPRVPHAVPLPTAPTLPTAPMGFGVAQPAGLNLPAVPSPPSGGAAAATGSMGLPPAPNLAPPPGTASGSAVGSLPPFPGDRGGGDSGGGVRNFVEGSPAQR